MLAESAPPKLIERFGLCSCAELDKFEGLQVAELRAMPCPAEHVSAILICRVKDVTEAGERLLVLAGVTDAVVLSGEPCLRGQSLPAGAKGPGAAPRKPAAKKKEACFLKTGKMPQKPLVLRLWGAFFARRILNFLTK